MAAVGNIHELVWMRASRELRCNNKSSVHYWKTKYEIMNLMKMENYDFDSWCVRAPAMWVTTCPPVGPSLQRQIDELRTQFSRCEQPSAPLKELVEVFPAWVVSEM